MSESNSPRKPIPAVAKKIFVLALILLTANIPRWMMAELNTERAAYSAAAVSDIVEGWGNEVHLDTKTLDLYLQYGTDTFTRSFVPTQSATKIKVDFEERHKGIFRVPLFTARTTTNGYFVVTAADLREKNITAGYSSKKGQVGHITGGDIVFRVENAKNLSALSFKANGKPLSCYSGKDYLQVQLRDDDYSLPLRIEYEVAFEARGYQFLSFNTSGKDESVELQTPWRSPSFQNSLPQQRDISNKGTHAIWNFSGVDGNNNIGRVYFYESGSVYQLSERCRKYGAFIILFLLVTFFLYEILSGERLHFMHYLLLTLPVSLFFLILLALSEHLGFDPSYWIATLLISALMSAYLKGIGAESKIALSFAALELGIFGMIYVILQSTDYALLMGSAALLIILSAAMYLTRKIDWFAVEGKTA